MLTVLYGFSLSYLILPAVGMSFDGSQFVDFVHSLPEWAKYFGKGLLAAPFAFHSWNGIRHLLWDSGRCAHNFRFMYHFLFLSNCQPVLSVKGAYATGYAVLGATAITTVGLLLV
jgi:succinate dehydrogenase (ubiquinone) cytochrome b560 subunit